MAASDDKKAGRLPRRLGRYILLSRLTGGGMTEVYAAKLAEEVGPGRLLVIKLLPKSLKDDPEAETRFLEEARILLNLTHGNITTAFEFGRSENDRPFLVMEYVPGPSLRRLMDALHERGERLGVPEALFIIAEVSRALSYAHTFTHSLTEGAGIIHRDISPDNIIIATTGQVKLTDFGIAQFTRTRAAGPVFGKAPYVAPEVASGEPPTAGADLYGLGAVLYECLTGAPPLKGKDDKETLDLVKSIPPRSPVDLRKDLPDSLSDFVISLLDKDPKARPASAADVQVELRSLLTRHYSSFTEPDLAKAVRIHFELQDFMEPASKEKLRADLLRAGVELGEDVSTADLLEGGTVRISEDNGKAPRRLLGRTIIGVALVAATLAVGLWLALSRREPAPQETPEERDTDALISANRQDPSPPIKTPAIPQAHQTTPVDDTSAPSSRRDTDQSAKPDPVKPNGHHKSKKHKGTEAVRRHHKSVDTAPRPETEWGWLNINSYPWSYVTVDGRKLTGHTPYRRIKLKSGPHELVFENPELNLRTTKRVTVTAFEENTVGVRLK